MSWELLRRKWVLKIIDGEAHRGRMHLHACIGRIYMSSRLFHKIEIRCARRCAAIITLAILILMANLELFFSPAKCERTHAKFRHARKISGSFARRENLRRRRFSLSPPFPRFLVHSSRDITPQTQASRLDACE